MFNEENGLNADLMIKMPLNTGFSHSWIIISS